MENTNTTLLENSTRVQEIIITPDNLTSALAKPNNVTEYQQLGNGYSSSFSWTTYASALFVVLIMLFALYGGLWFLRKVGKGRIIPQQTTFKREKLKVEAQLSLSQKKQLFVVRYQDKRLLLGVTEDSISLLSTDPLEEALFTQAMEQVKKTDIIHENLEL